MWAKVLILKLDRPNRGHMLMAVMHKPTLSLDRCSVLNAPIGWGAPSFAFQVGSTTDFTHLTWSTCRSLDHVVVGGLAVGGGLEMESSSASADL